MSAKYVKSRNSFDPLYIKKLSLMRSAVDAYAVQSNVLYIQDEAFLFMNRD
jgi:hypothetical protein